jgi:prolyl oligopeptidase
MSSKSPSTRAESVRDTLFGTEVLDPYRWLEDEKSTEVQAWMTEQDAFARKVLSALPGRDALASRLRALYYVDSISPPVRRGTRTFYARTLATQEKAITYWREGRDGEEHVLIDPNTLSTDGSVSLGVWVPSWDGLKVAYALKANNSDEATLYVRDVASGEVSRIDVIEGAKYAHPSWTPDSDGFYYTLLPNPPDVAVADRPGLAEVRYHRLGTDPKQDELIHEATGNPQSFIGGGVSRDGHWLFIYIQHGWSSTDVYFRDTRLPSREWKTLVAGTSSQYAVSTHQDRFYVHTNEDAPRYRLLLADPSQPERANWKELVAESPTDVLESVNIVGGRMSLDYLHQASSRIEVRSLEGEKLRDVELPGLGSSSNLIGEPDDDEAYYTFTSFTQPYQIFRTSVNRGETSLWAEVKLPLDPSPYTAEQVWFASKDGTKVSMFVVRRKDMPKDASTPFLLYGYGGFNVGMLPGFSSGLFPWLEAGGGYAVANLRGGNEYGEAWHQAGMGEHKQNVFDDFIAAAEFLIRERYTQPAKLAIRGGSNGGLLVGAAMTQRPELFRAVVCQVPLLDMVRYHLFGSGKTWVPEYGSAESENGFRTLHAYSPYHRVKQGTRYPAMLMLSADHDDRVDPMHARKFTAAIQAATSSEEFPVLLRIEKQAGHGGADLVKQAVENSADTWAFLMNELGLALK